MLVRYGYKNYALDQGPVNLQILNEDSVIFLPIFQNHITLSIPDYVDWVPATIAYCLYLEIKFY